MTRHGRPARLGLAVALACLLLVGASARAVAAVGGPDHWRVAGIGSTSSLNVRDAPAGDAARLGALAPTARCLVNLGCVGETDLATWLDMTEAEREAARAARWCRVRSGALEGWVAGRYLVEDDDPDGTCRAR